MCERRVIGLMPIILLVFAASAAIAQMEPAAPSAGSETTVSEGGESAESAATPSGCCGRCMGRTANAGMGQESGAGRGPGPHAGMGHGSGTGRGPGPRAGMGQESGTGRGPGPHAGMGCGRMGGEANHHDTIHALLGDHEKIARQVETIDGGIVSETTSDDPQVTEWIRAHVQQMSERLESGQGLRHWDPLFVEIFEHHDAIKMDIEEVSGGVRVRETSDDPRVELLIERHAEAVSGFVADGFERAHQPTPLPTEYDCPLLTADPPTH